MRSLSLSTLMGLVVGSLAAQTGDPLSRADSLLQQGDLAAAEAAYSAVLAGEFNDVRALVGRATARAWSGRYDLALGDYAAALAVSPGDPGALLGAGYVNLWSKRYTDGERFFELLLDRDPGNVEARKGLAYAALWSGRLPQARERFEQLAADDPDNADAQAGLAQTLLAAGRPEAARAAARRAHDLDPSRADIHLYERAARRAPSPVELSVTAGRTVFDGSAPGESAPIGVRSVDVAIRPTGALTFLGQYDNGISVDSRALSLGDVEVPTWRGAVVGAWGGRFITRVGGGYRSAPGADRQALAELDQVVIAGRVGFSVGWTGISHSVGPWEHVARVGVNVAPTLDWELGATGYLRAVRNAADGATGVFTLTRKFEAPVDLTGGLALGRAAVVGGGQHEVFGRLVARVVAGHGVSVTVRRQFGSGVDPFTVVAAGITVGLGRN